MARKPTKISKTRQQTHRFLYYDLSHNGNGSEDFHYIDLGRDLSMMNRRLYRQGMCYHVANITVHDSQGDVNIKFGTAPNTWPTYKAWKLIFDAWKMQRAKALEGTNLSTPKWSDFKVYLNKDMTNDVDWVFPKNIEQQLLRAGQWDYADMSFTREAIAYDNHAVGLLGPHNVGSAISSATSPDDTAYDGYISAIQALDETIRSPASTEPAGDDVTDIISFNMITGAQNADILNQIEDEGFSAPYSTNMVGTPENPNSGNDSFAVREAHLASDYSPIAHVGGFPVPCGLIQVETKCSSANTIGLLIELVPGDYKGVHALPMGA